MTLNNILLFVGLVAFLVSIITQTKVQGIYRRNVKYIAKSGLKSFEFAQKILETQQIKNVTIEKSTAELSDRYDQRTRTILLAGGNYDGLSLSCLGTAAHMAGHALQHHASYAPLKIKNLLEPLFNVLTIVSIPLAIFGIFVNNHLFANIGIVMFSAVVLFQLATLFVELDASKRALRVIQENKLVTAPELEKIKEMLTSCAWLPLAVALVSVANLLGILKHRKKTVNQ